jgi:SAM-dependent methyltransferase
LWSGFFGCQNIRIPAARLYAWFIELIRYTLRVKNVFGLVDTFGRRVEKGSYQRLWPGLLPVVYSRYLSLRHYLTIELLLGIAMIRCPECRELYSSSDLACSNCEVGPTTIDGFISWAPEIANSGKGFKREYFESLVTLESANFWFRARNAIILWAIRKYFPHFESLLEIGCGTGFVLSSIASGFPGRRLVGSEQFVNGLYFARQRVSGVDCVQMDACRIPYEKEFDVVGAFDVLEHIEDDRTALSNIYRAIKPGGGVVISVPQHNWLWSALDEYSCHVRRYGATGLHAMVRSIGFNILRSTSFVSLLLPAMLISRRRPQSRKNFDPYEEHHFPSPVNSALEGVLAIERALIQLGLNFPVGGSRLIVAKKAE